MVILFSELCREAGMRIAGSVEEPRVTAPRMRLQAKKTTRPGLADKTTRLEAVSISPAILALLEDLPRGGKGWTKDERDRWLKALEALLDYRHPILKPGDVLQNPLWDQQGEDGDTDASA
jgi:hypothetical protein